jgi:hypothetical protein
VLTPAKSMNLRDIEFLPKVATRDILTKSVNWSGQLVNYGHICQEKSVWRLGD